MKHVVELQRGKTRGPYTKFTPEQKAEMGKRAAEHGVVATVRYYKKRFPGKLAPAVSANGRGQLESSIREIYFRENFVPRKFALYGSYACSHHVDSHIISITCLKEITTKTVSIHKYQANTTEFISDTNLYDNFISRN